MDFVFHIGAPKAGSSSIQRLMETEGAVTTEHRIHYPDISHHDLAQYLTAPDATPYRREVWEFFKTAVEEAPSETDSILVSSEFFLRGDPAKLAELIEAHFPGALPKTRIVHYIRPHASFFVSMFVQHAKRGRNVSDMASLLEQFTKKDVPRLLFGERVRGWEAVFGERYSARILDRSWLKGGSITDDFLTLVCGETPFKVIAEPRANTSPSLEDIVYLRAVGEHLREFMGKRMSPELPGFMAYALTDREPPLPGTRRTKVALSRDVAEKLRDATLEDAQWLDARFGVSLFTDALDAAVESALAEPQSLRLEDHFPVEVTQQAKVTAEVIAELSKLTGPEGPKRLRRKRLAEIRATIK